MKVNITPYPTFGNRKVKVKVSSSDTYSLNSTLAHVIYPALVKFKKTRLKKRGCPVSFIPKLGKKYKTDAEAQEAGEAAYAAALDTMIWSFREIAQENPSEGYYYKKLSETRFFQNRIRVGLSVDMAGMQEYHARIQKGIDLFAKHYNSLWW